MRSFLFAVGYLIAAIALEIAVLPQLRIITPGWLAVLLDLQLLAMGGVLIGLRHGELPGMGMALAAAFCLGVSEVPGMLGPSIFGFCLVAWIAGWLGRHLRLMGSISRCITISLLLLAERFATALTHWVVWRDGGLGVPWSALFVALLTALIGTAILKVITRFSRRSTF